jgi:predicted RNA-binding protein Jag
MTQAEEKVREISDKLVNRIDELKNEGFEDSAILATVRNYLLGLVDGIDFSAEMNEELTNDEIMNTLAKEL